MGKETIALSSEKNKNHFKTQKGSILAYSLVILSIMLLIAVGISSVGVIEKKSASSTGSSTQALQTADGGIKLAIKEIDGAVKTATVGNVFKDDKFPCDDTTNSINMPSGKTLLSGDVKITFLKSNGDPVVCADTMDEIASIKSVATYEKTTRAVQVALLTSKTRAQRDIEKIYNAIISARSSTKTLIDITGKSCTECECRFPDRGGKVDFKDIALTPKCESTWKESWDKIVLAASIPNPLVSYLDPWGHPYLLDENEKESGYLDCRNDLIRSAGPDGILSSYDDINSSPIEIPFSTAVSCP